MDSIVLAEVQQRPRKREKICWSCLCILFLLVLLKIVFAIPVQTSFKLGIFGFIVFLLVFFLSCIIQADLSGLVRRPSAQISRTSIHVVSTPGSVTSRNLSSSGRSPRSISPRLYVLNASPRRTSSPHAVSLPSSPRFYLEQLRRPISLRRPSYDDPPPAYDSLNFSPPPSYNETVNNMKPDPPPYPGV